MSGFKWKGGARTAARSAIGAIGRDGFLELAEEAKRRMEPFVPYNTGALVDSASVSATDEKGEVRYDVPYASAVYYGAKLSFNTGKHPLATAFWGRYGGVRSG